MMAVVDEQRALERWWKSTQAALAKRGVVVVQGELAGARVPIIALRLDTAGGDIDAILEVLTPRLATWWTEEGDEGPDAYSVALLSGDSWHVVECGIEGDSPGDWDDENEDGYVDLSPTPEIQHTMDRWVAEAADELIAKTAVSDPHSNDLVGSALSARLDERVIAEAPPDDADRYHRAAWSPRRTATGTVLRALRVNHTRQIRVDAAKFAADILAADPDLATAGRVVRRDAVYRHMKAIDDQCVTRETATPVTAALESLVAKQPAVESLFG